MSAIFRLYSDAFRGVPGPVWMLSLVLLVNRSGTMVIVFLSLYLTQKLGYTMTAAGQVLSAYGAGHILGTMLGGWLCNRVGAMRIQLYSLLASGVGYLVMEHLSARVAVLSAAFYVAVTAEACRPANLAALATFAPAELRTRAMAINRMAVNLGFACGASVGGLLAKIDYKWLFRVDGITCIASGLLLAFLFRGRWELPVEDEAAEMTAAGGRHPLRDGTFLVFLGLLLASMVCFFQVWSTYPVYLYEVYGLNEGQYGLLMMMNGLLILVFEVVLTHRAEVFRPLSVVAAGLLLIGVSFVMLPLGRGMAMAAVSLAVLTFGEMLALPFMAGWVANRAPAVERGRYMGLYTTVFGMAFITAPAAGTWLYARLGGDVLWWLVAGVFAASALGYQLMARVDRPTGAR